MDNENKQPDERAAFERHWYDFYHSGSISARSDGRYMQPAVQTAWDAWQARATQQATNEVEQYVLSVLPSVYYMDPPDGGSVTVLEQLRRMADDAAKYRALQSTNAESVTAKRDKEVLDLIDERDRCEEWADKLTDAIALHLGVDIGEHSSANNPWSEALDAIMTTPTIAEIAAGGASPEEYDVRKILLRVVPGDGSGHEVYARNVRDVEDLLSELGEKMDSLEHGPVAGSAGQAPMPSWLDGGAEAVAMAIEDGLMDAPDAPSLTTDAGAEFDKWWDRQQKNARERGQHDDWLDLSEDDRSQYRAAFKAGFDIRGYSHAAITARPTEQRMSDAARDVIAEFEASLRERANGFRARGKTIFSGTLLAEELDRHADTIAAGKAEIERSGGDA